MLVAFTIEKEILGGDWGFSPAYQILKQWEKKPRHELRVLNGHSLFRWSLLPMSYHVRLEGRVTF
jgi:hypothetical protein